MTSFEEFLTRRHNTQAEYFPVFSTWNYTPPKATKMKLIIVRGLPGSGKSTFAKKLNIFHIEIDMFCMINGQYRWNAEQGRERSNLCFQATRFAIEEGIDTVVSNCFARRSDIEPYLQLAHKHHSTVSVHSMTGQFPSIHPVPSDVITRMRETWELIPGEISQR